jgi:hypothetical protein
LEFHISVPDNTSEELIYLVNMLVLGHAFTSLQQLRQLKLSDHHSPEDDIGVGHALRHMSALTNLTSLSVPQVRYDACLQFDVHH